MFICYLDEAGNTGYKLDDPDQPVHLIAAVMVREDRVRDMTKRLDELSQQAPTHYHLTEYHGYELFHGKGPWKGIYPRQRIDEYAKALSVLDDVEANVVHASINKPRLAARSYTNPNPHAFALQFLAEKIERWIKSQKGLLEQRVLLVADQNHEQEEYSIDLIREMQAIGGPVGSGLGLDVTLDHFVDSVYFDRSDRNRGIQLADLVAYLIYRNLKAWRQPGNPQSDAATKRLYRQCIDPHVGTWRETWPST